MQIEVAILPRYVARLASWIVLVIDGIRASTGIFMFAFDAAPGPAAERPEMLIHTTSNDSARDIYASSRIVYAGSVELDKLSMIRDRQEPA
jgi:hypothetical protein